MRRGSGKAKGSAFERVICKQLSLWISQGSSEDCFWRSAMSGGRATLLARKGKRGGNAAGDIAATGPEGHALTDDYCIELKHYRELSILSFLFGLEQGKLWNFWREAYDQAVAHSKSPMLIAKQNTLPTFVVIEPINPRSPLWKSNPTALFELPAQGLAIYWFTDLFPQPKMRKPTIRRAAGKPTIKR